MPQPPLLILTALDFEARPISRRLGPHPSISLHIIGPRARNLPPPGNYRAVILAGLAGALDPALRRGDILIDAESHPQFNVSHPRGSIVTTNSLASTPEEKQRLHRTTGALLVDMESAIVRDWAAKQNLPFLGIRAVSDTADESLDPATLRIIDDQGYLNIPRLMREILRRPSLLPALWGLRHSGQVTSHLAKAVAGLDILKRYSPATEVGGTSGSV